MRKPMPDNWWIAAALILFLIWKFTLIAILWADRPLPPEPDDSLIYTAHIYSIVHCPNILCEYPTISLRDHSGAAYLTYRLAFGGVARFFHLSPLTVFYASFYIGTVLMAAALLTFLRRLTDNPRLQAFALLMLALFTGGGSYHGFFWVVPGFFALALFWFIAAWIIDGWPHRRLALVVLVPPFVLIHPIAPYLIVAAMGFYLLYAAMTRSWQFPLLKNTLLVIAVTVATALPQVTLLNQGRFVQPVALDSLGSAPATTPSAPAADEPAEPLEARAWLPGWEPFIKAYVRWIVPTPAALVPLVGFIIVLAYYRQYRTLAWYGAGLALSLVALLDRNGQRLLLLLWPLTFILYAWGFWYTGRFFYERASVGLRRATMLGLLASAWLFFVAVNITYSYLFTLSARHREHIVIDHSFVTYLEQHTTPRDTISFHNKILRSYSLNTPLITRPLVEASSKERAKYYVAYNADRRTEPHPPVLRFLDTLAQLLGSSFSADHAGRYGDYSPLPDSLADGLLQLEHTAGPIKIYRNQKYPL